MRAAATFKLTRIGPLIAGLAVAACGRVDFDVRIDGPRAVDGDVIDSREGRVDGTIAVDCWAGWRAGTIALTASVLVAELGSGITDPSLSPDGLSIFVSQELGGNAEIALSQRASMTSPWTTPVQIAEFAAPGAQTKLTLSQDQRTAIFASTRVGGKGGADLWTATRPAVDQPFAAPTELDVAALDDANDQFDPTLTVDGQHLYYAPATATGQTVSVAPRSVPNDAFAAGVTITGIEVSMTVGDPFPSPDELVLVFSAGLDGGNNDVYYARRATVADAFANPTLVPTVDTSAYEGDPNLSADGCELYFRSDRDGPDQVYLSTAIAN